MFLIHLALAVLFATNSSNPLPAWRTWPGIGSIYYPGDGHCGKHKASCNGVDPHTGTMPCHRCFFRNDYHVAHRWLPLGMPMVIKNMENGRVAVALVEDRGPFGYCLHKRRRKPHCRPKPHAWRRAHPCPRGYKWVNGAFEPHRSRILHGDACGWWRGAIDMTWPVARELGATKFVKIQMWVPPKNTWHLWRRKPSS